MKAAGLDVRASFRPAAQAPALALALGLCLCAPGPSMAAFDPSKTSFAVRYKDELSPYRVTPVFLLPGEEIRFQAVDAQARPFTLADSAGPLPPVGARDRRWRAPSTPGMLIPLRLHPDSGADTMLINVFVMFPASEVKEERLQGYRIGTYPSRPLKNLTFYRNPSGFIRADPITAAALVSPHFTLGQFLCKQAPRIPSFLVLRERLVLKLETVLEKVNERGYACNSFVVMSGYRTPHYNRSLGNVKFSVHQWGGAADIFIDESPRDGNMDDLNGDGRSDGQDSGILFEIIDAMSLNELYLPYLGGIGKYSFNESHGPFVHVDVRGFRAIW